MSETPQEPPPSPPLPPWLKGLLAFSLFAGVPAVAAVMWFMGMLMLGLAGFGAVNLSGTVRTVAQVGDEDVSVDAYVRELQREFVVAETDTELEAKVTKLAEAQLASSLLGQVERSAD